MTKESEMTDIQFVELDALKCYSYLSKTLFQRSIYLFIILFGGHDKYHVSHTGLFVTKLCNKPVEMRGRKKNFQLARMCF